MRGLFGLLGLLAGVAIILVAYTQYSAEPVHTASSQLHDQAEQLSGRSMDGTPVGDSIVTEMESDARGEFKDLVVIDAGVGGGMQVFYGLQKGDKITGVGTLTTAELNTGDAMKQWLNDAYEKRQPIEAIRDGKKLTLPLPAGATSQPAPQNPLDKLLQPATNAPQ